MPTYDYECKKCGYTFEKFQKMTDAPLKSCPKCKAPVRRLIGGGTGLIFKGSGFYITDYKKKNSSSVPSKTGCSDSKKCSSSESCPAAKKDKT
ncbi:MAG: zinc ribbon domain-containing protein [Candidatus Omnitrophica bacterium]|nr:zinc ribbon domain-containing protein [Candidatus Omnitrophota bacterium]